MHLLEPLWVLQTKGDANGGLHWDAKAITLSAFRMMKNFAIIADTFEKCCHCLCR